MKNIYNNKTGLCGGIFFNLKICLYVYIYIFFVESYCSQSLNDYLYLLAIALYL